MRYPKFIFILTTILLVGATFFIPAQSSESEVERPAYTGKDLEIALQTSRTASEIDTINVEVDYMVGADHSHELTQSEIDAIVDMFACQGIVINIEMSDALPHVDVLGHDNGDVFNNFTPNTGFAWIKYMYCDHPGESGWHYCIMAHLYDYGAGTGSSGLAECPGDDFLVSLGAWWTLDEVGTSFDRAATFVHELGHNLRLLHAGDQDQSEVSQFKPNYASIMSYRYQLQGVRHGMMCDETTDTCSPFRNLDYSHGTLPALDESALDETAGMGYGPVDWNCNGVIDQTPVSFDLASFPCLDYGNYQILTDYDDWSNIVDVTYTEHRKALINPEVISCITFEEFNRTLKVNADYCGTAPVGPEPCSYPYTDSDGDGIGDDCDNCPASTHNDEDGDGVCGDVDNCVYTPNPAQTDINNNGIGDACECNTPGRVYTGEAAYDWFGYQVSNAGDFNGDGYDDLIVGAPTNDFSADNAGSAYIYSGKTGERLCILHGETAHDIFGVAVSGAGDVNLDSFSDVIVGAYKNDFAGINAGRAYVFYGRAGSELDTISGTEADMIIDGEASYFYFGALVTGIGDVDGEPGPDLMITARQLEINSQGKVYVYSGQTGELVYSYTGEAPGHQFGDAISQAGDFNDDGTEDFIVGAPYYNDGTDYDIGRAYVYSGSDGSLLVTITGEAEKNLFGKSVSTAGDINTDGYGDIIIGAPTNDTGEPNGGAAYVFNGYSGSFPEDLTTASASKVFTGAADLSLLGWSVSYTRDMNDDGINELVVGEPVQPGFMGINDLNGRVHIYSGSDGSLFHTVIGETREDLFGFYVCGSVGSAALAPLDLIVGVYNNDFGGADAGRAYVYYFGDNDEDGILDNCDNCPSDYNPTQTDTDDNGIGNACERCCVGVTGNVDCSEEEIPDMSDIVRLIDYLYISHNELCCPEEADVNVSGGESDISDITRLIDHLYLSHDPLSDCP